MTHDFGQRFDAVFSIAVLHHLPLEAGLERMKQLTSPGGVVGVVGPGEQPHAAGLRPRWRSAPSRRASVGCAGRTRW